MSLKNQLLNHAQFGIKLAVFSICLFTAVSGRYPPVFAESHYQIQTVPVITTEDSLQDDRISQINKHLQATDDSVKSVQQSYSDLKSFIDTLQGEERAGGFVLLLITGTGLVIQIKRKQV